MSTAILEAVLEQVKELTPEEQQKVRDLLDSLGKDLSFKTSPDESQEPLVTEEDFLKILLARGVISHIPPRHKQSFEKRKLIEVKGKPLSETIIEERR